MDWMEKHEGKLGKKKPEDVYGAMFRKVLEERRKGYEADLPKRKQAEEDKKYDDYYSSGKAGEDLDKILAILKKRVWKPRDAEIAEDRENETGYLIMPSDLELKLREQLGGQILHDYLEMMKTKGPKAVDPDQFFKDWLATHPEEVDALVLAAEHPYVEKYHIEIDIPAWQTAVEVGVSFIPIVGEIVGAYEVVSGRDLFGNKLGPVERGIMGVCILLPMVAKVGKLGKAAIVASDIAKEYRLTEKEADAVFRVYAGMKASPGTVAILERAQNEIKAGKKITNQEDVKAVEQLMKDTGLADKGTLDAIGKPADNIGQAEARMEKGVARDIEKLGVNKETEPILRENAGLRNALIENDLAAEVFRKCNTPCFPKELTPEQVKRMQGILQDISKSGEYDKDLLREYLYKNRGSTEDLQKAIDSIAPATDAAQFNAYLDFFVNRGGKVTKLPSREEVAKIIEAAYTLGETKGLQAAKGLGYAEPAKKFVNPFRERGKFGQGFDDILVRNGDLDTGIIAITEYKGGSSGLSKGQMTLDWVLGNIEKLEKEGGADGRFWADKLRKALKENRLEGMLYSTPRGKATQVENLGFYVLPK
jgi:hypothetical protein